jgi:hypothetical protein
MTAPTAIRPPPPVHDRRPLTVPAPDFIADRDVRTVDRLFPLWIAVSLGMRDKAANFWSLASLSMRESWRNSHHADPTYARRMTL